MLKTYRTPSPLGLAALLGAACILPGAANAATRTVSLASGTVVTVHLNDPVSSNDSTSGDRFTATVQDSDARGKSAGLPVGSRIDGVVRSSHAMSGKNPGTLDLAFRSVTLPNGSTMPITGSLIGLDGKSVTKTSDGRLVATKSHRTNRLTMVGIGAGAGLIGSILLDKKNTLRDVLLGAAAGYGVGALEKGGGVHDVTLKQGQQLGIRLDRSLRFTTSY